MKDFLLIGPVAATTYPDVVELFKHHIVRGGYYTIYFYDDGQGDIVRACECFWYTTLMTDLAKMRNRMNPVKVYTQEEYPEYDDYPAIEVNSYKVIPFDYEGLMGVPTTVVLHDNGNYDYEIVDGPVRPKLNGKTKFPRLIIRRKQLEEEENATTMPLNVPKG